MCWEGRRSNLGAYSQGFEEDDRLRSAFIRDLTLRQLKCSMPVDDSELNSPGKIPKVLVRYWHDPADLPADVRACLDSWGRLREVGFECRMFSDETAARYIDERYGDREREAFARCRHPAMRSDYLRMCFVLADGGIYVDADDVLLNDDWKGLLRNDRLKIQPLCYDVPSGDMLSAEEIWRADLQTEGRIFYVNNNPIAAPPGHPLLRRALARATARLLSNEARPEIQSTTGPGNFTAALAAHARDFWVAGAPFDFELIHNWDSIAKTRWDLSYRGDARNWRNMDAS